MQTIFLTPNAIEQSENLLKSLAIVSNNDQYKLILDDIVDVKDSSKIVSWLNAHALTLSQKNASLASDILKSSYVFRDGVGISVLLRLAGLPSGFNLNGTDLIPEIIRLYAGKKIALLGTQEPFLSKAAKVIQERMGGQVVLCVDGFQDAHVYAERLAQQPVDLVILAMGMPKQEGIATYLAENAAIKPCLILNGGAILDFMADRFPRAPLAWRKCRLEWLYRLIQEPKRLWRRYILGGILFVIHAIQISRTMRRQHKN